MDVNTAAFLLLSLRDVALAAAALIAAIAAWRGFQTWKRQLRGRADFDLARRLAKATYEVRDGVELVRFFASGAHESLPDSVPGPAMVEAYKTRWAVLSAAVQRFEAEALEAEAVWGESIRAPRVELRRCVSSLRSALEPHSGNDENGPEIGASLDRAIVGIEALARDHLRR